MDDHGRKTVLVTGPAGKVGERVRPFLRQSYRLRLMYHRAAVEPAEHEEVVHGDILDLQSLVAAMDEVEAVLHLAAYAPWDGTWEAVREPNIDGVYNVFEAARRAGVRKIVFASTNHVTGGYERDSAFVTPEMPVRPDGYYGASKAFGEALARYYSDAFGISIHCLRIGSFLPEPNNVRALSTWLSPRDCGQLIRLSIESDLPFGIFYGVSGNARRFWDISNAQALLGYRSEDDAEEFASRFAGS